MSIRNRIVWRSNCVGAVVALLILNACHHRVSEAERATNARRVLVAYFECGECTAGQLTNAAALGGYVVPSLRATLEQGPSNARIKRQEQFLRKAHKRIVTYRRSHPGPLPAPTDADEERFVQAFLANYKAQYQIRAATVLAAIGSADARKALEESLQGDRLRSDVRDVVSKALGRRSNPTTGATPPRQDGPTQDGSRPDPQSRATPAQPPPRQ